MREELLTAGERGAARSATSSGPERADRFELRPRGVGALLDQAIDLLVARPVALVGTACGLWLLALLAMPALERLADEVHAGLAALVFATGMLMIPAVISAIAGLVTVPWLRGETPPRPLTSRVLAALPGMVAATLLTLPLIVVGLFPCGLGAVYFWWRFFQAPIVVVAERCGPIRALRRSWELSREGFWRWMGLNFSATLMTAPLALGSDSLQDGALGEWIEGATVSLGPEIALSVRLLVEAVVLGVPAALSAAGVSAFYSDARVRRDGWDLEVRLEHIAARPRSVGIVVPRPAGDVGGLT